MIWNVLLNLSVPWKNFMDTWDIHIWSLKDMNTEFFEHITTTSGTRINPNMAAGVTGQYRIDLYLIDDSNDFISRSNSDRVQHELCHAVLYGKPEFVSGVHKKNDERDYFHICFWYWNRFRWSRFQLAILNIKEYLD